MTTSRKTPISLKKRLARLGLVIVFVVSSLYLALVWWCVKEIAEPSRRSAGAAHQPYFDGSAMAGFAVNEFVSSDGMPGLVCTPQPVDQFSKRAGIIRGQADSLLGTTIDSAVGMPVGQIYQWRTGVHVTEINSAERARDIRIPTLVVHGDTDNMVPTASGRALYEATPESTVKQWLEVPNAGHSNVLVTNFPIDATMARWLLDHVACSEDG